MLNPFPELLAFGLLAPFIIRICLGVVFIRHGYFKLFKGWVETVESFVNAGGTAKRFVIILGSVEIIGGIMLFLGFLTQIAALTLAVITLAVLLFRKASGNISNRDSAFAVFLSLILISLMFSGAGFFAFDIPL